MVKFLHTADWHLGLKAIGLGEKAKEARARRFETAERVVDIAKKESVDFIVLAGDTFDDHNVDDVIVKRTVDILNRFSPIKVFVLPGTHDPLTAGGIWDYSQWKDRIGNHIQLLRDTKEISLSDEVVIYPCPLKQKMSPLDPTEWIPRRAPEDARIRIGVAHGALDILPQKPNFPIAPDRPERAGLDYLALGDWHSQLVKDRVAYPGTFEQTSFDEKDSGNILLVEIRETGARPVIRPQKVGLLAWHTVSRDIQDISDVEAMERTIKALASLKDLALAVDLRIPGTDPEISGRLSTLRK
jgi:DNA repair exonuclease SbcCD nuclease subunit